MDKLELRENLKRAFGTDPPPIRVRPVTTWHSHKIVATMPLATHSMLPP
jgi:hypothetical protein